MVRDQSEEPMTDADLAAARAAIREQRSDIREYLEGEGVDVSNWDENVTESDREPADSE